MIPLTDVFPLQLTARNPGYQRFSTTTEAIGAATFPLYDSDKNKEKDATSIQRRGG